MDLIVNQALTGMAMQAHVHRGQLPRVNTSAIYPLAVRISRAFMTKFLISRR